jgi:hypothetical protein
MEGMARIGMAFRSVEGDAPAADSSRRCDCRSERRIGPPLSAGDDGDSTAVDGRKPRQPPGLSCVWGRSHAWVSAHCPQRPSSADAPEVPICRGSASQPVRHISRVAKRSYGTGRLYVVVDRGWASWYGSWWVGGTRVKRKVGLNCSAGNVEA